jgi:HK97 family phage prohead protease
MSIKVNGAGRSHANSLVASGDVDKSSDWSFTAEDGNKLLGSNGDDWSNYGKWHLAIDASAAPDTKGYYKYPFGKDGKVYRSGVIAVKQRAAQQGETDVESAASSLLEKIDAKAKNSMNLIERRSFAVDGLVVEDRDMQDGKIPCIRGHAAVFNAMSEDLGGFRETILPGAFSDSMTSDDVRALYNHDPNYVLGRNRSGTLRLAEDSHGLAIEIDPPDTTFARDLLTSMRRGDISQMSFGFMVPKGGQSWQKNSDGSTTRTLSKIQLLDVSPVTFPAYPQTDCAVRSLEEFQRSLVDDTARQVRMRMRVALAARSLTG